MSTVVRRNALVLVWSVAVWCALWSDFSLANVLWGAVVGVLLLWLMPVHRGGAGVRLRPLWAVAYLLNGLWSLVKSSAVVAWEVVTPVNHINQAIVEVPLRTRSVGIATLVANTVSLTPGTLTLEVRREPPALYVHIMHLRTIEDVRAEVTRLETLALRAFPPDDVADATHHTPRTPTTEA